MRQNHKNANPLLAGQAYALNDALRTKFKAAVVPNKKKHAHPQPKRAKYFDPASGRISTSGLSTTPYFAR